MQRMRLWMRGEGDVYAPLRRRAGKWLDRLRLTYSEREGVTEVIASLEEIRYGPRPDKLEPFKVFVEAKKLSRGN